MATYILVEDKPSAPFGWVELTSWEADVDRFSNKVLGIDQATDVISWAIISLWGGKYVLSCNSATKAISWLAR